MHMAQKYLIYIACGFVCFVIVFIMLFGILFSRDGATTVRTVPDRTEMSAEQTVPRVIGAIVPYHADARDVIVAVFARMAHDNRDTPIDRIVLVVPCSDTVDDTFVFSDGRWSIGDGYTDADHRFIAQLLTHSRNISVRNDMFATNAGMHNILPFVHTYFPDTKIVPMVIGAHTDKADIDALARLIASDTIDGNTLVVVADNFAQDGVPKDVAAIHNRVAMDTIRHHAIDDVYHIDAECVGNLAFVMAYARYTEHTTFDTGAVGQSFATVAGFFHNRDAQKHFHRTTTMLFVGDVMLDRMIRTDARTYGAQYFTQNIARLFLAQNINMCNCEGPITQHPSVSNVDQHHPHHFIFTFDPSHTKTFLTKNHINVVSIGNNHILNFGHDGVAQTESFLRDYDVSYVGVLQEKPGDIVYKHMNDKTFAFVSYNQFAPPQMETVVTNIQNAQRNSDYVIVYAHWGAEYNEDTTPHQREAAHAMIDAGADIIIGSHPHVIEPIEIYNGKVIFYSLGNFVFDQYFSATVRERMAVVTAFEKDAVTFVLVPLYAGNNGQLEYASAQKRTELLRAMAERSFVDDRHKKDIQNGVLRVPL